MPSTRASQDHELAEELRLAVSHLVRSTRAHADGLARAHAETLATLEDDERRVLMSVPGLLRKLTPADGG